MTEENCDPKTGVCTPSSLNQEEKVLAPDTDKEIIYVGDPMCSWCWGISNHLKKLKTHFSNYKFTVVVGGLRPGGGDAWDDKMKDFLKHHWEEVTSRSRQPFGYSLFERAYFNYDTEPSCRAVVASRSWTQSNELAFFEAVSRKFYVNNEDPTDVNFYKSICEGFDIPFEEFKTAFESEGIKYRTHQDFQLNRQWGVKGYPTIIFKSKNELYQINNGYSEFDEMKITVDRIVAEEKVAS